MCFYHNGVVRYMIYAINTLWRPVKTNDKQSLNPSRP